MARAIMDEIKEEVEGNKVVVYIKGTKDFPQCGFSAAVLDVVKSYGVEFKDVNILADEEKWMAMKTFSDWPTMPQVYIDGDFVGGCDIVREMHAKGELKPLFEKAGVLK